MFTQPWPELLLCGYRGGYQRQREYLFRAGGRNCADTLKVPTEIRDRRSYSEWSIAAGTAMRLGGLRNSSHGLVPHASSSGRVALLQPFLEQGRTENDRPRNVGITILIAIVLSDSITRARQTAIGKPLKFYIERRVALADVLFNIFVRIVSVSFVFLRISR